MAITTEPRRTGRCYVRNATAGQLPMNKGIETTSGGNLPANLPANPTRPARFSGTDHAHCEV